MLIQEMKQVSSRGSDPRIESTEGGNFMKAFVDQSGCIGCGLCADTCPEVFRMNDEGLAEAYADVTDATRETAQEAPPGQLPRERYHGRIAESLLTGGQ